jgi:CO/xanthine dehydrogenase Mo-binding subunit
MVSPVFLEDIYPQHLLYAATIRSPIAKGCLKTIQVPEMPGGFFLITAKNIPGINKLEDTSIPILADTKLSYIGEPVALLIGNDKIKLEELAKQCIVLADEETPSFVCTCDTAAEREIRIGNVQEENTNKGFTGSYITGIQDHWYAEPAGAITWYKKNNENKSKKPEKTLIIRTATQWPYHVKRSAAAMLGADPASISVEPTSLNIHMDGKLMFTSLIACHAALGTFVTGKPVRLILNKEEDFFFSPKRCGSGIDITSLIDENGRITASDINISVNLGAHGVNGEEILDQICLGTIGFYNYSNLKLTAKAYKTNLPPQGPFSGFGLAQGFFAMERHVSEIADTLNQDPAVWRKNHINSRMILPSGQSARNHVPCNELIEATAKMSDYYRKWAAFELLRNSRKGKSLLAEKGEKLRGIGIAIGFQGNDLLYYGSDKGNYGVEVTLTKESTLEIKTSITSSDEDFEKIWAKIASETFSIARDMVHVINIQTPDCGPSCSSRNITTITRLVQRCCQAIRKQLFHAPLPITVRRSVKPQNGNLWDGRFPAHEGKNMDITGFSKLGLAVAVVEVSIDIVECLPKIRGVWLGVDGGKIISMNRAKRCLRRSGSQALGWAFSENIEYINGSLSKNQYTNFSIPSPVNIPPIHVEFFGNTGESKGIGELPFTCIPAAFIQAVSQAMDYGFKSIPLKRNDIWELVRQRNMETAGIK